MIIYQCECVDMHRSYCVLKWIGAANLISGQIDMIQIAFSAGLSGDEHGDVDGVDTAFTKEAALTVTVTVTSGAGTTLQSLRVFIAGGDSIELPPGTTTIPLLVFSEGLTSVSATAVVVAADGRTASKTIAWTE